MKKKLFSLLFIVNLIKLNAQCGGYIISNFPDTLNGVTVTQTYTGSVTYSNTYTLCNVVAGPTMLGIGFSSAPFSQTLSFSAPVNNIIYALNGSDSTSYDVETFTFTVNAGSLTTTQNGGCLYTQVGNVFKANAKGANANGAYITLNSTSPYTSLTVSGNGGANGSFMALCSGLSMGINQYYASQIQIYPSPASNVLNINNSLQLAAYNYIMYWAML